MPPISKQKKEKICEQIMAYLFVNSPETKFTSSIAKEIARDEEFTKKLLIDLQNQNILTKINKNSKGKDYIQREKWRLSNSAFEVYKTHQNKNLYNNQNF